MDTDTILFDVVREGTLQGLKDSVEDAKDKKRKRCSLLDAADWDGWTVLHLAVLYKHPAIIQWLLSSEEGGGRAAGFTNVLAKDNTGWTALHLAAKKGYLEYCKALVYGSNVKNGEREELLNGADGYGWTVLHLAALYNQPSIIKWLLSSEEGGGRAAGFTKLLEKDKEGKSALHRAAERGHLECFQALVEGSKIENEERTELLNAVDGYGLTVLHIGAYNNRPAVVKWILSSAEGGGGRAAGFTNIIAKDNDGESALHRAVARGHLECCRAIVEGCKVENGERAAMMNGVNRDGWTVLHYAANYDQPAIIKWLLSSEEGECRAAGFTSSSIIALTDESQSALHLASQIGRVECLNALLSGCTVGERLTLFLSVDKHGWTALHEAARRTRSDIIRELLLRYPETQTIVDHRDHRGMTALHRAVIGGVDEKTKKEWKQGFFSLNYGKETVVAALLTAPKHANNNENKGGEKRQQSVEENQESRGDDKSQQRQPQAAMVDPNVGTKME